jgi:hypothetical protein
MPHRIHLNPCAFAGYREYTQSVRRLHFVANTYECQRALFNQIESIGSHGNNLKYSGDLCEQMRETWTARLDVASTAYRAVYKAGQLYKTTKEKSGALCDMTEPRGQLRRAKYMLKGIDVSCKGKYGQTMGHTTQDRMARASIRKSVAEYAFEALSSNGRERYQGNRKWLSQDPVWQEAKRYMQSRVHEFNMLQGSIRV